MKTAAPLVLYDTARTALERAAQGATQSGLESGHRREVPG